MKDINGFCVWATDIWVLFGQYTEEEINHNDLII